MSFQLSRRDVDTAYAYANRNMRHVRDPERGGKKGPLGRMLDAGEIAGGAFAVGVLNGRFEILRAAVPLDLVGGISGHLLAFWLDNKASDHIHNVSNGVLAAYGMRLGTGAGITLREKAGLPVTSSGADPYQAYQPGQEGFLGQGGFDQQYDIVGAGSSYQEYDIAQPAAPLTEAELAALAQQVR